MYSQITNCEVRDIDKCCLEFVYDYTSTKNWKYQLCLEYDLKEDIQKHYCTFRKKQLIKEFKINCYSMKQQYEQLNKVASAKEILTIFKALGKVGNYYHIYKYNNIIINI